MFRKLIILTVLLTLLLSGCTITPEGITFNPEQLKGSGNVVSEPREVNGFTRVDLRGIGNLTITRGEVESLTITADDNVLPYITTEVVGDTLEIDMKPNWTFDQALKIEYALVVKNLTSVTLSGFGDITADALEGDELAVKLAGSGDIQLGSLESKLLDLRISGFGDISVDSMQVDSPQVEIAGSGDIHIGTVKATDLAVTIKGFGDVELAGQTGSQDVKIAGTGDYNAADLESDRASIEIAGFGEARIWVKSDLAVKINGGGTVEYYGNPHLSQTMTGFGEVNSLGEH